MDAPTLQTYPKSSYVFQKAGCLIGAFGATHEEQLAFASKARDLVDKEKIPFGTAIFQVLQSDPPSMGLILASFAMHMKDAFKMLDYCDLVGQTPAELIASLGCEGTDKEE